ncbi:MAG: universal stress protein [Isosphaeraceae bacterium]|nr:universal stress protein [Isosphaeraceae bacterium]
MVRSILVGLDGSPHSASAIRLGIDWARRDDALLVGLAVIDQPTIAAEEPVYLGGVPYADPIYYRDRMADARREANQFLEQFALRCAEAGVACKVLEDVGLPADEIALEAQRYDLIMIGQKTRFHFEVSERRDDTLTRVLKESPRPVVVVPESWNEGQSVVVAYDGSLPAARALYAFEGAGLARGRTVHVVTVQRERLEAARQAERACDFLRFHAIPAVAHAETTTYDPSEVILRKARELEAGLIVMGSHGQSAWREFLIGSVTRSLIRESPAPLFLFH